MLGSDNDKHGTSRLIKILAIAATAVAVASSAIVGTVAAQTSQLFDDVPRGHYAHDAIEWAVENGITVGCGDGTNFCPTKTLNRAQMVTFLKRYHDKFGTSGGTGSAGSDAVVGSEGITFRGTSSRITNSVQLTTGRWRIDFDADHDSRLALLEVIALGEAGEDVLLVDEVVSGNTYSDTVLFRVSSGSGTLDPGKVWFEINTRTDAEWTLTVAPM